MVRSLPIFLLFSFSGLLNPPVLAQQLPLFSLSRENQGLLNPAAVNSDFMLYKESYRLSLGLTHRSQWVGNAGKTATQTARGEFVGVGESSFAPLIGIHMMNDQVGPTSFTGIYGRVATIFGIEHPNFGGFSAGLQGGLVQFRVKASEIDLLDPDDVVGQSDQSQWHPDVGLGIYYYKNIERYGTETALIYAGISATQLFALDLTFDTNGGEFPLTRQPHFYAMAGVYKFLDAFSFLEISTWIRSVKNVPLDLDINIRYQLRQKFWIGAGSSLDGRLQGEFGLYLLQVFEGRNAGNRPLVKLSAGFDYRLINTKNLVDKAFEINLSVIPRWRR